MELHDFLHWPAVTCDTGASLAEVGRLMHDQVVGSVVVVDADDRVAGLVTDRDLAIRGYRLRASPDSPVSRIMTTDVLTLPADADVFDAAATMAASGCRRLPVIDEDQRVLGIVSLDDIIGLLAQQFDDVARAVTPPDRRPVRRPVTG